jgi:hypothetical protein
MLVGASVPVTGLLAGYPVLSGQAIGYAVGAVVLYAWLVRNGRRVPRPGLRDLLGLAGMLGPGCSVSTRRSWRRSGMRSRVSWRR